MNKKYIDFVPTKKPVSKTSRTETKRVASVKPEVIYPETRLKKVTKKTAPKVSPYEFGVIEDTGVVSAETGVKPVEKSVEKSQIKSSKSFEIPKAQFINQEKVVKRPLSKNVYRKEVVAPKEEPKGPVTIIAKPEKDAHVSMVVAVIITIILGAAAGTVAFLLLPK